MSAPRSTQAKQAWILAEFSTGPALLAAARRLRELNFPSVDTCTPYPLHGADETLGLRRSRMPLIVLLGGIAGVLTAWGTQYYCNVLDYPIDIGGRPLYSPPTYIPITFELMVLFGSLAGFIGLWALCGLPRPYHPVFEVESFRTASVDRFWLTLTTDDRARHEDPARAELEALGATRVVVFEEPR
jgi:hypothetical protein